MNTPTENTTRLRMPDASRPCFLLDPAAGIAVGKGRCPFCDTSTGRHCDFNSDKSRREYSISGLCQDCQDQIFSALGDDDEEGS